MHFIGPSNTESAHCERILRTLPRWFGIEASLMEYVAESERMPTFLAIENEPIGFVTLHEHFPRSWEIHCMALDSKVRGKGIGRALHEHVEAWLRCQGAEVLQVKTLAAAHPSLEYAETRQFYASMGYLPLEVFPNLWGPNLPVLQLLKNLSTPRGAA